MTDLDFILKWHDAFHGEHDEEPELQAHGTYWWQVGRNASHRFYLGFYNGVLSTVSRDMTDDEHDYPVSLPHQITQDRPGYCGHF